MTIAAACLLLAGCAAPASVDPSPSSTTAAPVVCTALRIAEVTAEVASAELGAAVAVNGTGKVTVADDDPRGLITDETGTVVIGQAELTPKSGTVTMTDPTGPTVTLEQVAGSLPASVPLDKGGEPIDGLLFPTNHPAGTTMTLAVDGPTVVARIDSPVTLTFAGSCDDGSGATVPVTGVALLYDNPLLVPWECHRPPKDLLAGVLGKTFTEWCRTARSIPVATA
jgi:hypothetical protein